MRHGRKLVAVSGGFDPLHIGHVRMIRDASFLGSVVVILNNDNWLMAKKGFVFMPQNERREIMAALVGVEWVYLTAHEPDTLDKSVCKSIRAIHPDIFVNGGDRLVGNIPEYDLCREMKIEMRFNVGGGKIQSSSALTDPIRRGEPCGLSRPADNGGSS